MPSESIPATLRRRVRERAIGEDCYNSQENTHLHKTAEKK